MSSTHTANPAWTWICPVLALVVLAGAFAYPGNLLFSLAALALAGAVFSAVHHAELVAHRIGES